MPVTRIIAILLTGTLLITGACAQKAPRTAQIKIELIDATEEWRPSTVSISAGGVVTWTNTGRILQHSVISGEGLFNKNLSPGESFSYTFTRSGTFTYHDEVYISVGTIYVE